MLLTSLNPEQRTMNRMKKEHNVARLWVDCFDYQSNTVILAELVFRGRPQPVHNLACNKH